MALRPILTHLSAEECAYGGSELAAHFLRQRFGVEGDAMVAFFGPCEVRRDALVDLVDREAGAFIRARRMLHVIVERFDPDLDEAVLLQRLLVARAGELVGPAVQRRGDDLFAGARKLSVSIATISPVSQLIHLAFNVDDEGAPVPTVTLAGCGVIPQEFAAAFLEAGRDEVLQVCAARAKVSPVGCYRPVSGGGA